MEWNTDVNTVNVKDVYRDYRTSNQPVAVAIYCMSKVLHSYHSKEKKSNQLKSYRRKIQESWYKNYPWIAICSFQYRIFYTLTLAVMYFNFTLATIFMAISLCIICS